MPLCDDDDDDDHDDDDDDDDDDEDNKERQLENPITTRSSPSTLSAAESSCKELKNHSEGSKPKKEPEARKSLVGSCETKKHHSATNMTSTDKQRDHEKKAAASVVPSAVKRGDVSNNLVNKGTMGSDESQSSDPKESDRLSDLQGAIQVEGHHVLSTRGNKTDPECTVPLANNSMSVEATASEVNNNDVSCCSKDAAVTGCEPSEMKVFECLCKEYDCSVLFTEIAKRTDLFPKEYKDIESWFRKKNGSFQLTANDSGGVLRVNASSANVRLCVSYNDAHCGMCTNENCTYLHVCKDYVTNSCSHGATCPKNHHFHNEKDKALLSSMKLEQLTDQQLRQLVLSSTPQICVEYNDGVCDRGDKCSRIHMCRAHLRKCYEEECRLDHESAMTTDHTRSVLERYHMDHLNSGLVKRIILVYVDSTKMNKTGKAFDIYVWQNFLPNLVLDQCID